MWGWPPATEKHVVLELKQFPILNALQFEEIEEGEENRLIDLLASPQVKTNITTKDAVIRTRFIFLPPTEIPWGESLG